MADIFGNIASGLSGIVGDDYSSYLNTAANIGRAGLGAYELYSGLQAQGQQRDYMSQLLASQQLSDKLLKAQAERAESLYHPIEDLQAEYALSDLQAMRPLQTAQQEYALGKGMDDIAFAQEVIDPTQQNLLRFLAEGVDSQEYRDIASTDVQQAFGQAQREADRAQRLQGINPSSGAAQSLSNQLAISKASALSIIFCMRS